MKKKIGLFLLILMLFFTTACNQQQVEKELKQMSGNLVIEVTDKTGTKLEGVQVDVKGLELKETNEEGIVKFSDLQSQEYELKVYKEPFPVLNRTVSLGEKSEMLDVELDGIAKNTTETIITNQNEYIDINDHKTKFWFKTNPGNKVNFYLGEAKDKMEKVKSVEYQNEGLVINDLKPDETYYYQIESINKAANTERKTEVLSFEKLGNTNNWEPAEWAEDAVFYEVFVRSFYDGNGDDIGDFAGLKEKIPYFKKLGVDALWLMPINKSHTYHGYDVEDYYKTDSDYGSREEFIEFLEAAHKNDLKVIMDLVVNHTADEHKWFQQAKQGAENKYRDYYVWRDLFDDVSEKGPWGQKVWHKYFTDEYYYATFWNQMPDLNFRNQKVRQEMKKRAKFWLDPDDDGDFSDGVDGFRLDAALHIDDKDPQVTHNWWQEFNTAVKEVNPDAFLVGENWTDTETMAKFYEDLDASFNFTLADKIVSFAREGSYGDTDILAELKKIHQTYSMYSKDYIDATFLRNHDQNRVASELEGNKGQMKLAASVLFTLPGTPFIYYGEELGQSGKKPDPNIREPFDWYKDAEGEGMTTMNKGGFNQPMKHTKADDGISLAEQRGKEGSMFEHYQKLIKIRKENSILFDGQYDKFKTTESTYGYKVSGQEADYNLFIVHNKASEGSTIELSNQMQGLLTGKNYQPGEVTIKPYGTLILKSKQEKL